MKNKIKFGAFIISLDFELHWGIRDAYAENGPYRQNLLGAREVIPNILDLFQKYNISATWGIVGFLFAKSLADLNSYKNSIREPSYRHSIFNPFQQNVGKNEQKDPIHYAPTLIKMIQNTSNQEIASHTTSHFYPNEKGQTRSEFASDLKKSIQIANSWNIPIDSLIYPRNQHNPNYTQVLIDNGIKCFRGNPNLWFREGTKTKDQFTIPKKVLRFLDSYFNLFGHKTVPWRNLKYKDNLLNIRTSSFLRPYSKKLSILEGRKINRIKKSMTHAAKNKEIFHLYWHPHNFGRNIKKNLNNLVNLLQHFHYLQKVYEMKSLSMAETTQIFYNNFDNK